MFHLLVPRGLPEKDKADLKDIGGKTEVASEDALPRNPHLRIGV